MAAPKKHKLHGPADAADDAWEKIQAATPKYKTPQSKLYKAPPAKRISTAAPKRKKKKPKGGSPLLFRVGAAALVLLVLLVLYVELFVEKRKVVWPDGYSVYGVDVSKYQKDIDWQKVRANEISFAFVKATEGASLQDNLFKQNWEEARQAGILCGAYHFYRPHVAPLVQARNFISLVELQPGDLPPVLDIEVRGRKPEAQFRKDLQVWLREVEEAYNTKPIIYTNYTFYKDYLAGHFDDYHLWIAHYKVPKLRIEKTSDLKLAFWQHTDGGAIEGIEGDVDCNVFYGSMRDLKSVCVQ
ncbi:glycoside hydrolase family 25 protein [Pontibacter liquoris]|uniref:glycoside hydrolase family 25 protein n=1 Tax=Pontibacter liquoris TaxID=2905677 RepID=UPI001FA6B3D0|nr:glycoside hydrolase family 25 protein [Pontibacter liquoris]